MDFDLYQSKVQVQASPPRGGSREDFAIKCD
jgi:hypothetical protein